MRASSAQQIRTRLACINNCLTCSCSRQRFTRRAGIYVAFGTVTLLNCVREWYHTMQEVGHTGNGVNSQSALKEQLIGRSLDTVVWIMVQKRYRECTQ